MSITAAGADRVALEPTPDRQLTVTRNHHVTAVVVAHNGQRWLPRVLRALADSTRTPDAVIAVDTGSTDRTPELLADDPSITDVVTTDPRTRFAQAVAAGVDAFVDLRGDDDTIDLRDGRSPAAGERVDWIWVLHDDSAPADDALSELLRRADELPVAEIVGPKLRSWSRPDVLQECGLALTAAGRPVSGVAAGEVDQGQLDGRVDVLAVSSAGMLIRRELWDRLGGFSSQFADRGVDTDFCWRARRAGARVVVAPRAVVFHRRSASTGQRGVAGSRGSTRRQHRRATVFAALVHAPFWRLPFTLLRVAVAGLLRLLLGLVTLSPRQGWDDAVGTAAGLLALPKALTARRAVARTATIPDRELRHLRASVGQRAAHLSEVVAGSRPGGDERPGLPRRGAHWGRSLALTAGLLAVVSIIASWELWFGTGRLAGGALLPAPDGTADLVASFLSSWHEVGLGSAAPAPPYLAVLAAVSLGFLGSATMAVQVLLLAAPVAAGVSMLLALRGLARRPVMVIAAVTYGLIPTTLMAVDTGRLGTAVAAALLPLTVRMLVRSAGFATPLPPGNRRTVVTAAILVALLGAFVPALAIALLVLGVGACLVTGQGRGVLRLSLIAVASIAALWPWSGALLTDPGRLLLEVGAVVEGPQRNPLWQLALLLPAGPGAAPAFVTGALVVAAVLALLPGRTRRAVVWAWSVILAGLVLALWQSLVTVSVPWSDQPVAPWAGPGTLLMSWGAIAAVVAALQGLSPRRMWGRGLIAVLALAPLLVGGWWLTEGESLVTRQDPGVVSPFVSVASVGPDAPRSLALAQRGDGTVTYELLSGVGPRIGDADVAPPIEDMAAFNSAVSRMTAGSGPALDEVAAASVQFLTVAVARDRDLARQLDAVPGLSRVSTIDGQGLWEVVTPVPRVRAVTPDGVVPLAADGVGPVLSGGGPIPADATAVQLSELAAAGWRADIAGSPLTPSEAGQWQAFEVPAGTSGDVVVSMDQSPRLLALGVAAVGFLVLLVGIAGSGRTGSGRTKAAHSPDEPEPDAAAPAMADGEVVR